MHWMQQSDGKAFDLLDPKPSSISIEVIAKHLSQINRFTGATKFPYSVAQHSVLVSRMCRYGFKMAGLLHDGHEAFLGDISTPVKEMLGREKIRAISDRIDLAICHALLDDPAYAEQLWSPHVKEVDTRMMETERLALLPPCEWEWEWTEGVQPYDMVITRWSPDDAEALFLHEYEKLCVQEGVCV